MTSSGSIIETRHYGLALIDQQRHAVQRLRMRKSDSRSSRNKAPEPEVFTIVRLAYGATLERACELAAISPNQVNLRQRMGEKAAIEKVTGDFRVISFDGQQITISERINGERRVRGFSIGEPGEPQQTPLTSSNGKAVPPDVQ